MCELFRTASRQNKTIQDRNINAKIVQVLQNITLQYRYPLKISLFLNFYTPKILVLLFCKCAKNCPKMKIIKNEGQIWKKHYQISSLKLLNLCRKLFCEFIFPKIDNFYVFACQKHLSRDLIGSVADPYHFKKDPDPGCEKIRYGSGSKVNFDTDPDQGKNNTDPDPAI